MHLSWLPCNGAIITWHYDRLIWKIRTITIPLGMQFNASCNFLINLLKPHNQKWLQLVQHWFYFYVLFYRFDEGQMQEAFFLEKLWRHYLYLRSANPVVLGLVAIIGRLRPLTSAEVVKCWCGLSSTELWSSCCMSWSKASRNSALRRSDDLPYSLSFLMEHFLSKALISFSWILRIFRIRSSFSFCLCFQSLSSLCSSCWAEWFAHSSTAAFICSTFQCLVFTEDFSFKSISIWYLFSMIFLWSIGLLGSP